MLISLVIVDDLKLNGVATEREKKLKIFRADPFDYQSITDALKGCSGLFYAFEPPQDHPAYDVNSFLSFLTIFFRFL